MIKILDENKIKVIKSNFYSPELTLIKGTYSKIKPDKHDLINIKIGIKSLNKLNQDLYKKIEDKNTKIEETLLTYISELKNFQLEYKPKENIEVVTTSDSKKKKSKKKKKKDKNDK